MGGSTYIYTEYKGHYVSSYPIMLPLVVTPLYVPVALVLDLKDAPFDRIIRVVAIMEKIVASLMVAISVTVFYLLAITLTGNKNLSIFLSLIYAFATETWAISSQSFLQHGFSELMIIGSLLCLTKLEGTSPNKGWLLVIVGLFVALAIAERPTNLLFALPVAIYILIYHRRGILYFLTPLLLLGTGLIAYNLTIFGDIRGYYTHGFTTPILEGLAGLLISPSRGLFIYTPIFVFSTAGMYFYLKERKKYSKVYPVMAVFIVLQIILISKWFSWYGGWSYGPRLLTDISPPMVLFLIPAFRNIRFNTLMKVVLTIALTSSIFIQIIGAFFYPRGFWDRIPVRVDVMESRLWDWQDTQIVRTLLAGPDLKPYRNIFGD